MINLLPTTTKETYRYARRNRQLMPWLIALVVTLAGLGVIGVYGLASSDSIANNYSSQIATDQAKLNSPATKKIETKARDISNSLNLSLKVLGREVMFSKLLKQLGTVVPSGVNLTGLNINQDDRSLDINAKASSYNTATQLQANITDPHNKIFSKADLVSVSCNKNTSQGDLAHPCTMTIRALLNSDNNFLFINDKSGAKS